MKVKDIGLKEVYSAEPSSNLAEVAVLMKRHNIGVVPICEDGNLLGMITDRDMVLSCVAADIQPDECRAREFMTSNPVTVSSDNDLEEAAKMMGQEQLRRLPVVDGGRLLGIVSLGDVSAALKDDGLLAETLRRISEPP
jgi:CBS domain-containing protein